MIDLESAPDKPLPREIARYGPGGIGTLPNGRPPSITDEVAEKIIQAIAAGSFYKPACEAVGVSYEVFRESCKRGMADEAAGLDTRYSRFSAAVTRAQAAHQTGLAATFTRGGDGKYPDWRAQAFLAERRYEHWRLPKEQASAGLTLQLSNEQLQALSEALRVGAATNVSPITDVMSTDPLSTRKDSAK